MKIGRIENNIAVYRDTMRILQQGYYYAEGKKVTLKLTPEERADARVFLPEQVHHLCEKADFRATAAERCIFSVENMDSFTLARKRCAESNEPVLVLNLANPVHPGGGVKNGATAQEEDLCRKSSLMQSLDGPKAEPYYRYNRALRSYLGSDGIILSHNVEIIKDERGNLLPETCVVSVMTCAAPNIYSGKEGLTDEQYEAMLYKRISGMLNFAACCGYRVLVLGAFGCGAFCNDANLVSDLFYKAVKNLNIGGLGAGSMFRRIDFAVLDRTPSRYNYRQFARNFDGLELDWKKTEYTFFWHEYEENGCFSNWYVSPFVVNGITYCHTEQYFMAQKALLFGDTVRYSQILSTTDPSACKHYGRLIKPFVPAIWETYKYEIMKAGNRAKFLQHPELRKKLIATCGTLIAEASPKDKVWGIGIDAETAGKWDAADWPGQNLLGRVLMELRSELA